MNQCRGAREEAVPPPPRQAFGEDRKHIANGYLCSGGSAPRSGPNPGLFSHFCFPSQLLTHCHILKGHTLRFKYCKQKGSHPTYQFVGLHRGGHCRQCSFWVVAAETGAEFGVVMPQTLQQTALGSRELFS